MKSNSTVVSFLAITRKRFKVNDHNEGDIKGNSGWHGLIIGQEASEKHPRWLVRWEGHGEQSVTSRAIKKLGDGVEEINAAIEGNVVEADINDEMDSNGPNEDDDNVSLQSESSISSSDDDSRLK